MKRILITTTLAAALAAPALALHDYSLEQRNQLLPRDHYVDLVSPEKVNTRHVVLKFSEETRVRLRDGRLVSLEGHSMAPFEAFLKKYPMAKLRRTIYGLSEQEVDAWVDRGERLSGIDLADMNNYYTLELSEDIAQPKQLLLDLLDVDLIQTCHFSPLAEEAVCNSDVAPTTGDYEAQQEYMDPAPEGVGMQYAWDFSTYGDGTSGYWIQDIEQSWCPDHEDMDTNFTIYNDNGGIGDHGIAVVGVMHACDNGFGVTGMVHDTRATARDWANTSGVSYPDISNAIAETGNSLILGETYLIEVHAPGPTQGTTCTCNCGQFEYIAMEYWTDNFDAISVNSANGIFCAQAAGNGSMDLDSGVYGNAFQRWFRDSDAVVIGAGSQGNSHDPMCWTSHGSRVDVYGWGEGVETLGYGNRFDGDPGDCSQEYTFSFSGTSSATPIVASTMASLALIHRYESGAGAYPSAATLRSRLQKNGTPQNSDFTREISVLPNMMGILAPDLEPYVSGWDADIVPKITTAAPDGEIPATALAPAPATTYIDWKWINSSFYSAANPARSGYYRDDALITWATYSGDLNPNTFTFVREWGHQVRGGRHMVSQRCDDLTALEEGSETNNDSYHEYVWEGTTFTPDSPVVYSRGPKRAPANYFWYSCDGFYNGGDLPGFWEVYAAASTDGSTNYDIRGHAEGVTATTGFGANVASSSYGTLVDFVGTNANGGSDMDRVGVLNPNDSNSNYVFEGDGSSYLSTPTSAPILEVSGSLDANELVDAFELNLTDGEQIQILLEVCSGSADLAVFIYGPSQEYFTRSLAQGTFNSGGPGDSEEILFTPTETGFHCVVIAKDALSDVPLSASYNFIWGLPTMGDLTHGIYGGADNPFTLRNDSDPIGITDPLIEEGVLDVDAGYTNIGFATFQSGSNTRFSLNGPERLLTGDFSAFGAGVTLHTNNRTIGMVLGGRHELGVHIDVNEEIVEPHDLAGSCSPFNNSAWERYVVEPYAIGSQSPMVRSAAPNYRDTGAPTTPGGNFMQHGYSCLPVSWSFMAAVPVDASSGLNIHAYDYHATDNTALLDPEANTIGADGETVLVGINDYVTNGVKDVGINHHSTYPADPSTSDYVVEFSTRQANLSTSGPNGPFAMNGNNIVDAFAVYLTAGSSYDLTLGIDSGNADLGIAVYAAGLDYVQMYTNVVHLNSNGGGQDETGSFSATVTGWHGVAVYKTGSVDLGQDATYRIRFNAPGEPAQITDLTMTPVDFSAGLAIVNAQWTPVTEDVNGDPLEIDHYVLEYADNMYFVGFGVAQTDLTNLNLNYHAVGMLDMGFLRVYGVDTDGWVVSASVGADVPANTKIGDLFQDLPAFDAKTKHPILRTDLK